MFCPKCGMELKEEVIVCENCGCEVGNINMEENNTSSIVVSNEKNLDENNIVVKKENKISFFMLGYIALAIIVFIIFFMAAESISDGGNAIMQIQSVGGKTLDEAYYYELGSIYSGYAMIARGFGVFFSAVLFKYALKKK